MEACFSWLLCVTSSLTPPLSLCLLQMAGVVSGRDETSDDITEDKSAAGLNLLCLSAFRSKQQKKR